MTKLRLLQRLYNLAGCLVVLFATMSCDIPESNTTWKFAYMSDHKLDKETDPIHYTNIPAVQRISADIVAQDVNMVIIGGDLVDGRGQDTFGLNTQYTEWIEAMSVVIDAKIPVFAVPGNHEYWGDTENSCNTAWNETIAPLMPQGRTSNPSYPDMEYSFAFKNAFFLGLNQNQFEQGDTRPYYYHGNDMSWISAQLAKRDVTAQPHVIAFGHMPQFQIGYEWDDTDQMANRDDFWNILGGAGAKMYLTGHSHLYALASVQAEDNNSLYQIIAGSGGAELNSWDGNYAASEAARITPIDQDTTHEGYALIAISDRQVTMEWRYYDPISEGFISKPGFTYEQP